MLTDLKGRTQRLGELSQGLTREVAIIRESADPLLYTERRRYIVALQTAVDGLETARVVLVEVAQRMAGEAVGPAALAGRRAAG